MSARPIREIQTFRLDIEYDGGRYQGWQKQGSKQTAQGVRTVAGTLERVLREAGLEVINLTGSGRTDGGVHARGQVAHLHLAPARGLTPSALMDELSRELPQDIAVTAVSPCPRAFHARHDALARTYDYQISLRRSAFAKPFVWWVRRPLDLGKLERAWHSFEGFHDLSAFADLEGDEDPRCDIQACTLSRVGSLVLLRATASHFLRKQVRRMVGAAVWCALGEEDPRRIALDLDRPTEPANLLWGAQAAPSAGLFLRHVRYSESETIPPLQPFIHVD